MSALSRSYWLPRIWGLVLSLFLVLMAGCAGMSAPSQKEKIAIQNTMDSYIQVKLASGGGTYDIEGVKTSFDYLHEGVKQKGDTYVSCADFKYGGDVYDVDYYVKDVGGQPMVVKEVFHKKNGEKLNRTLWEK